MLKVSHATTFHKRVLPLEHSFIYPVYYWAIDLAEISQLSAGSRLLGHNRFAAFSLYDCDFLEASDETIELKLRRRLAPELERQVKRIALVTTPRYFGYVFNPVSFYYLYADNDELVSTAFEVHNTFEERHCYVLPAKAAGSLGQVVEKQFYVSPFNPAQGHYTCDFLALNDKLKADFSLFQGEEMVMQAGVSGKLSPTSGPGLLLDALLVGPRILLTLPRITWQAAKMYYQAKLPVQSKPLPLAGQTVSTLSANALQSLCAKLFESVLSKLSEGKLVCHYPNGEQKEFGRGEVQATLEIFSFSFFVKVVCRGDVGLGEAYTAGLFRADDLTSFLRLLVSNRDQLEHGSFFAAKLGKLFFKLQHFLRRNSLTGSKKNISAHYDLSNELFKLFLDPTLSYSSAYFQNQNDSLEQAQFNKIDKLIAKAGITASDSVLEIGSGWGGLAIRAVQTTGCRVTTITLSREQQLEAQQRIAAAGLNEKIEVLLCDYRNVQGVFDKIVSVEMLEAVGYQYYGAFFAALEKHLKPDGVVVLQVITLAEQRFEASKAGDDWIQQYIFPGSTIPSLAALLLAMQQNSGLVLEHSENIAPHYAKTLRLWREAFLAEQLQVKRLGFSEEFIRAWEYYFSYCEAGFAQRVLGDLQLVLTRPQNKRLIAKDVENVS